MQENLRELEKAARITILAQGDVFTLAKASVFIIKYPGNRELIMTDNPPLTEGSDVTTIATITSRQVSAEGMARRSHLDKQDLNRGQEIASGRALKALARKLQGNGKAIIHHRFMG